MKFRKDIQGLRAIAVLLVILHHAFPNVIPGGYIGVDVFFVISGYLITNILIGQHSVRPHNLLVDFYARRIRRIIPIAVLGILVASLFAEVFLGPVIGGDTRRDGFFALFFVANWHFNDLATDYFSSNLPPSIFQHYWSLAVEEQFYLFWPLLIVLTRRWSNGPLIAILFLSGASLLYSILQVEQGSGTAFFATQTRIWELGFGALLAITNLTLKNKIFSTVALASIIALAFLFSPDTGFPGLPALLVVSATTLLIASSESNRILSGRALGYLGDISYALYIWHWIVLQGAALYLSEPPSDLLKVLLLFGIFAMAALSSAAIENPIRRSVFLRVRPQLTVLLGVVVIALAAIALKSMEVMG